MYRLPVYPHSSRLANSLSFFAFLSCLLGLVLALSSCGSSALAATHSSPNGNQHFSQQFRLGFHSGDDWEPSITSDRYGHVYALYKHYDVTGGNTCPGCGLHMVFQRSADGGSTWTAPRASIE